MRALASVLFVAGCASNNVPTGTFATFVEAHNAGRPSANMTPQVAAWWREAFPRDHLEIISEKWASDVGLAEMVHGGNRLVWVAVDVNHTGDIEALQMSFDAPPRTPPLKAGQTADVATTAVALSQGFVEANPLLAGGGLPLIAGAKLLYSNIKLGTINDCYASPISGDALGWTAAAWNAGMLIGLGAGAGVPAFAATVLLQPDDPVKKFWSCIPGELYETSD